MDELHPMTRLIYATTNAAKLASMRDVFRPLPLALVGLDELSITPPGIDESGGDPLSNARLKAAAYARAIREQTGLDCPVFSCDSGLFIDGLPDAEQPGVHIRRVNGRAMTDDEMVAHYAAIAARFGGKVAARYQNAVCLIDANGAAWELMDASLALGSFFIVDKPHPKRVHGFPIDSLSVHIDTGMYFYDMDTALEDGWKDGFRAFFRRALAL